MPDGSGVRRRATEELWAEHWVFLATLGAFVVGLSTSSAIVFIHSSREGGVLIQT